MKPETFASLHRAALIREASLWSPAHDNLANTIENLGVLHASGPDCEDQLRSQMSKWRSAPSSTWIRPIAFRLTLEDGTLCVGATDVEADGAIPQARDLAAATLAMRSEAWQRPVPERVEAHRQLELLVGQALPYLWDAFAPSLIKAALTNHPHAAHHGHCRTAMCRACHLSIGHMSHVQRQSMLWVPHQHFRPSGMICPQSGKPEALATLAPRNAPVSHEDA